MKGAAEAIDRLLSQLGTLLRYVAPGFAAIYVIAAVIPRSQEFLIPVSPQVVVLGMLLGFAIYALHTALLLRIWWFPIVCFRQKEWWKCKWICKKCDPIWKEMSRLDYQRWKRRASEEDDEVLSMQKEMDKWAAMQHFLYCLSYSMILIPLWARVYAEPNSEPKSERVWDFEMSRCAILLGGCLVFIVALISEYRITGIEERLCDDYPDGIQPNKAMEASSKSSTTS